MATTSMTSRTTTTTTPARRSLGQSGPPDHVGWAYKQGSKVRTWKRRFFVLRGRELRYYATQGIDGRGVDQRGRVLISGLEHVPAANEPTLLLTCERKSQPLKIRPPSPQETREWLRQLRRVLDLDDEDDGDDRLPSDDEHLNDDNADAENERLEADANVVRSYYKTGSYEEPPPSTRYGLPPPTRLSASDRALLRKASSSYYVDPPVPMSSSLGPGTTVAAPPPSSSTWSLRTVVPPPPPTRLPSDDSFASSSLALDIEDLEDNQTDADPAPASLLASSYSSVRSLKPQEPVEGWVTIGPPAERQGWKKRYAILNGPELRYYATKGGDSPLATIKIIGVTLSLTRSNALDLHVGLDHIVGLSTDSRDDLIRWDRALAQAFGTPSLVCSADEDEEEVDDSTTGRPSSYTGVHCEGWLMSQRINKGSQGKDWARRYFVLNGATFHERKTPTSPPLDESFVVDMAIRNEGNVTEVEVELLSGQSVRLRAENNNTRDIERWIHSLSDLIGVPPPMTKSKTTIDTPSAVMKRQPTLTPIRSINEKRGWLSKEGYRIRSWKKRYFELEGDTLQYSEKPNEVPKGSGIVARVIRSGSPANSLEVHFANGRIVRVAADSKADIDDWYNALRAAANLSAQKEAEIAMDSGLKGLHKNYQHGWLLKRGQMVKSWKRRYFVLERNRLLYYDGVGGDLLGSGTVFDVSVGDQRPFCLNVRFQNGRLLYAVAADQEEFDQWFKALQSASNISESFMSHHSTSQEDFVLFDKEFDNDTGSAAKDPPRDTEEATDDEDLGTGGLAMWSSAMKNQPEWDGLSSWNSESDNNNNDDSDGYVSSPHSNQHRDRSASGFSNHTRGCYGWLKKQGGAVKSWKRRYFTLHGAKLSYFKSEKGGLLRSFEVKSAEEYPTAQFGIAINMQCGRRLIVSAETREECETWLFALWGAVADDRENLSRSAFDIMAPGQKPIAEGVHASKCYSGWLEKEGHHFKMWKKRYFTLKNGALIYYSEIGGPAQGHGIVSGVKIDKTKPHTLQIELKNDKTLRVSATNVEDMNSWYQVLRVSRSSSADTVASSEVDDDSSELSNSRVSQTSASSAPRANQDRHHQPAHSAPAPVLASRFVADDYLANDTVSNESFLRLRGETGDGTELSLTNGSFNSNRTFKGDLTFTPTLPTPGETKEELEIDSDSDDELKFIRQVNTEDDVAEVKRRQLAEELKKDDLILPGRCACCVIM